MKLYDIVFSPTGGTQKVAALLTEALGGEVTHRQQTGVSHHPANAG